MRINMIRKLYLVFLLPVIIGLSNCGKNTAERYEPSENMKKNPDSVMVQQAIANLAPTKGYDVSGTVKFTRVKGGIKIVADVEGLTPGKHGFHVHENGDCTSDDASSAGPHFNPDGVKHGGPNDPVRHVGDMGNLDAGNDGKAHYEWVDSLMTFEGPHNIIGRSVIVHGNADDFKTQPSGNSGPRVACGIIEVNR
jgi:Cu-Zn family superoxide dismutase